MKGFAHFVSGVAVATFFPQVVDMASGGSLILLLAGLGGLVPDTLDFRLTRYLSRSEIVVDPDPNAPDAQAIADQVAAALNRAYKAGERVRVQFHPIRVGTGLWRRYVIRLEGEEGEVRARIGPLVTTSQVPYPGSAPPIPLGRAPLRVPLDFAHNTEIQVDVLSGPTVEFERRRDRIEIVYLPWHRRWSHSLTATALLGGLLALLFRHPLCGLVYGLSSVTHILQDQLGHMGCDLFYPLTRGRVKGLGLFHSGDALPNLATVWLSGWLILFNLDRFSPAPVLDLWTYLLVGLVIPWMLILGLYWWNRRRRSTYTLAGEQAQIAEALAEIEGELD